uniref:Keratin 98 n=1 Tax=Astyanax mexicanus TaxID=7994 RepID=A0A3B1J2A7_ASTMX
MLILMMILSTMTITTQNKEGSPLSVKIPTPISSPLQILKECSPLKETTSEQVLHHHRSSFSSPFNYNPSQNSSMSFSGRSYGNRTQSMYGGAGGQGTRISTTQQGSPYASLRGFNLADGLDLHTSRNEKATMQNLNDRLASYMQNVQSLEKRNAELEQKIRDWYESHSVVFRDHSDFLEKVKDLRDQIEYLSMCNTKTVLDIDNSNLVAEDFRIKYETERNLRTAVEADTTCIRSVLDQMVFTRSDLEQKYEDLKEELAMLEKNHEEEMALAREQTSQVNVSVDAAPSADLNEALTEVRQYYENVTARNRSDLENWYQNKISTMEEQHDTHNEELQNTKEELKELKSTFQRLQIELQTHHNMRTSNEETLRDTEDQFTEQLSKLQKTIDSLELQLKNIHTEMANNKLDYDILLNLKSHLETEITEYRLLLEAEDSCSQNESRGRATCG